MPFDVRDIPPGAALRRAETRSSRQIVAVWLFSLCAMLLVMVVLGGVTRLTGSGLSIMEWAPVDGILPPMTHRGWEDLFSLYKTIPQYKLLHPDMTLAGFKGLFWLEWVHRLWGRLIGFAVLVPLLWLAATRRIDRRLVPRLALIFVLGGVQGAVGWFMVASGFAPDSISVAPARLVIHLGFALALYVAILWTGLSHLHPTPSSPLSRERPLRILALFTACVLALTILAGGFVAGTHAGYEYNTFPLMDGQLIPQDYARLDPFWANLTQNLAAVQFDHRVLATLSACLATALVVTALAGGHRPQLRAVAMALGALVLIQYGLGVATLLLVVPVPLAAAHQGNAALALTAAIMLLHRLRPARRA